MRSLRDATDGSPRTTATSLRRSRVALHRSDEEANARASQYHSCSLIQSTLGPSRTPVLQQPRSLEQPRNYSGGTCTVAVSGTTIGAGSSAGAGAGAATCGWGLGS